MTREELIEHLDYLINKYIKNASKRYELQQEIQRRDFYVAKGILDEVTRSAKPVEQIDSDLIKAIAFNFS